MARRMVTMRTSRLVGGAGAMKGIDKGYQESTSVVRVKMFSRGQDLAIYSYTKHM